MLKGIKKSTQPSSSKVQTDDIPKINPTLIKAMQMQQEQQENQQKINEKSQLNHQMIKCYDLFVGGQPDKLKLQLAKLKQIKEKQHPGQWGHVKQQKSKFSYEFNALDDDQEKLKSKKRSRKDHSRPIMQSNRISDNCLYCPDNEQLVLLSASNYVYLALPLLKTFPRNPHLILAPVDHEQTLLGLNEDVITEINNYKKCLLQMYDKIGMHVCFFEQFNRDNSHCFIECLVMDGRRAADLPFFFKQGLEGVEGNWNTHQNIIKIEKEKGGILKQIPKQLKYFYIDFSLGYGYAHIIQNQKTWKRQFVYEILATALGIQKFVVKTTEEWGDEEKKEKKKEFDKIWKKYDWTVLIE